MRRVLAVLGSLRLTFPALVVLAAGVVATRVLEPAPRAWLLVPLGVLAVNLLAAIAVHPRLRRGPLLAFHLCLLGAMLLSLAGTLVALDGRVEVLQGQAFAPQDVQINARGPWHPPGAIAKVRFVQERFTVHYGPGLARGETTSTLRIPHGESGWTPVQVGDTRPLVQRGFRFYTTSNKGLAAVITWIPDDAAAVRGAIHFPSWPLRDWKQVSRWRTPGGDELELELDTGLAVPGDRDWTFDSARVPRAGVLRVRGAGLDAPLAPGGSVRVGRARLRFEQPGAWMGYRIAYDPTLPWLLACGLVGALALGWHFLAAFAPARAAAGREQAHAAGA